MGSSDPLQYLLTPKYTTEENMLLGSRSLFMGNIWNCMVVTYTHNLAEGTLLMLQLITKAAKDEHIQ